MAAATTARIAHDRAEAHLAQVIEQAIRDVLEATARDLEPAITAAGSGALDTSVLKRIAQRWAEKVQNDVLPALEAVFRTAGRRLVVAGEKIPGTWEISDHVAEAYLRNAANRMVGTSDLMFGMARNALTQGIRLGESPSQLAARIRGAMAWDAPSQAAQDRVDSAIIERDRAQVAASKYVGRRTSTMTADEAAHAKEARDVLKVKRGELVTARSDLAKASRPYEVRSTLVARTEVTRAYNAGQEAGALVRQAATGEALVKEWLATDDPETREDHALADGQVVPVGSPFMVGDTEMSGPGDPDAPAEETCNCRCSLLVYRANADV